MEIKYFDNKETHGIVYDWKFLEREFKKLVKIKDFYTPPFAQFDKNKYFINLSERSVGKTTQWLLLGCLIFKHYNTPISYVRTTKNEIKPSTATTICNTLINYNGGYYIKELTDGKYNNVYYHWGKFYYSFVDDKGELQERAENPFMYFLSVDNNINYKSTLNIISDFILYDEFIGKETSDTPVLFADLCKTIIRERKSPIIILSANTINLTSNFFYDYEITNEVRNTKKGEGKQIVTPLGTHIYFEIIDLTQERRKERNFLNALFFGFKSPKLASVTGVGTWAFDNVPHIKHTENERLKKVLFFIETVELLRVEMWKDKNKGYFLRITKATRTNENDKIFHLATIGKYYGFGCFKKLVVKMYNENLIEYQNNEIGHIFKNYFDCVRINKMTL